MRIAGGEFRGRTILVPKSGAVRPTQDRVREALFSMLQCEVPGADFLDLFSGTGAVGLEALSRGAARATMVEADARHVAIIRRNAEMASARRGAVEVVRADVYGFVASYSGRGFTIAFADPPYALGAERGYARLLEALAARGAVRPGGIFAAEMASAQDPEEAPGWELVRDRRYGATRLCIWRRADLAQGDGK